MKKKLKCIICGFEGNKDFINDRELGAFCNNHRATYYLKLREVSEVYKKVKERRKKRILGVKLHAATVRSKSKGWKLDIDLPFLKELMEKQDNKCAYTNIEFNMETILFSPSLDRIDSKKGYTKDNVQFVLHMVNRMKQDFTEESFIEMCRLIYMNSLN